MGVLYSEDNHVEVFLQTTRYKAASEEALERALRETRAYAPWRGQDRGHEVSLDERYASLPSTDKAFIRDAHPDGLVPRGKDLGVGIRSGEVEWVTTSGTTDERVTNLWNQRWWDFSERASWALNAVASRICTGDHREAILASARNVGFLSDDRPLAFEERRLGRFLFLNEASTPEKWPESTIARIVAELARFEPQVLEANPSYLARFARAAARLGREVFQPELIVFTYENTSAIHLRQIREVLRAPFASSYGTTEAGYVLMQCERGAHHINQEACRVDFVPLEGSQEGLGTIRVTPFENEWTALLRFDPGDIVRLRGEDPCPCGRDGAFTVEAMEGRMKSLTAASDGRPVTQGELDRALACEGALVAYQLVQEGRARFTLKAVLGGGGRRGAVDRLREILAGLYGTSSEIRVEVFKDISPEVSGKFLLAKSLPG
jgi:phenylacetate-CoA ligase